MSSSARIQAAFPTQGSPNLTTVTSGSWAVEYDWLADRVVPTGVPHHLGFPTPFDTDLSGLLPGQAAFTDARYVFGPANYLRLRAADGVPDGDPREIAAAWGLPAAWSTVDAVFGGGGVKSGFAYFFRGPDYVRYDWATDAASPGYPKQFASNWHTTPDFAGGIDGSITGQAGFATKAYLFKTAQIAVNNDGVQTAGGRVVPTTIYARYDYDTEVFEFQVTDPAQVVTSWPGLLPMLDAGPAIDLAVAWIDRTLAVLAGGAGGAATTAAFAHHFGTGGGTVDPVVVSTVRTNYQTLRARLLVLPDRLQYTPGLIFAAQTSQGTLMEISDPFSLAHGPNGRAAVMIHETVHFTFGAGPDVPEWSGATIAGVTFGEAEDPSTHVLVGNYASLTTAAALTNPSSYAAFAQEVALGTDERFGIARPHE